MGRTSPRFTTEEEARRSFRALECGPEPDLTSLLELGQVAIDNGWVALARDVFTRGAGACTAQTADDLVIGFIVGIATVLQAEGEHARAIELLEDMLRSARAHVPDLEHAVRLHIAVSLLTLGDTPSAAEQLVAIEVFAAGRGAEGLVRAARALRATMQGLHGDAGSAMTALREQLSAMAEQGAPPRALACARLALAARLREAGEVNAARAEISGAITVLEALGDAAGLAWAYQGLGVLDRLDGEWGGALSPFERALRDAAPANERAATAQCQPRRAVRPTERGGRLERRMDVLEPFTTQDLRVEAAEPGLVLADAPAARVPEVARPQIQHRRALHPQSAKGVRAPMRASRRSQVSVGLVDRRRRWCRDAGDERRRTSNARGDRRLLDRRCRR